MPKVSEHKKLLDEIAELKAKLFESNSIIEAIKDGDIDALVLNMNGKSNLYAIESADYTYRLLIEKFSEGALSVSDNGLILFCNKSFSKLVGVEADKIIGTYFNSFIDSVGQFHELKKGLKGGKSKGEIILNVEGRKVPVMMSLTDLNPQVNAIGIIINDLTSKLKQEDTIELYQRKLELKIQELNKSNEHLEQFIHIISHNIKEPLRKIVTYSSQFTDEKEIKPDHPETNSLGIIRTSALRLTALVDELMHYTISSGKIEFKEEDLNAVITEVMEDLEISFKEHEASLKFSNLPRVLGSKVQMRQLFANLIAHSITHKKTGTKHKIDLIGDITDCVDKKFPNKKFYRICLRDSGTALKPEQLKKIFTFSHRTQTPNEFFGNGIGLAICKKIMENHHGKIEVASSSHDGTTFNLYFPVKYS
ncbi:MAG: sensor signal transduction histidine kinase, phytochrome A-like protein [Bacteroidetes bacterium]|jgi:PAS domain S-box-containing protein|nr:sensor signal transduction histidine kinase, phytochrome A-like protein [Bacteroidota bacterium]